MLKTLKAHIRGILNERARKRKEDELVRDADVVIVSAPKAGRTWMRVVLMKIAQDHFGGSEDLDIFDDPKALPEGFPRITFVHHARHPDAPEGKVVTIGPEFQGKKIIFLSRDPRDTTVSYFYQLTKRSEKFEGTLSDFLKHPRYGIERLIDFMNVWIREYEHAEVKDFMLLKFEDLKLADPVEEMARMFAFMDTEVPREVLEKALDYGSFDNMRKMEREGAFAGGKLRPKDVNDTQTYKVRKGKVGGWADDFTEEDTQFATEALKKLDEKFGYE